MSVLTSQFTSAAHYRAHLLSGLWNAEAFRDDPAALYEVLRSYYWGNGLYDDLRAILKANDTGKYAPGLLSLRNPASAAVEFYAATLWSGSLSDSLEIESDNEKILAPIQQVWSWSNWGAKKQAFARNLAMLGDQFVKVATRSDAAGRVARVYFQLLDPVHVSDFDVDERDFLTFVRLDIPQAQRDGDRLIRYTHTEVWDKASGSYRVWETQAGERAAIEDLGEPKAIIELKSFGIDFVPVVHCKFRDVGDDRGVGCFTGALEPIDEANRMATRLHQMLFRHNKADLVLSSAGRDDQGRSIPPPAVMQTDDGTVALGDEQLYALPAGWDVKHLVAPLNYADALAVLEAQLASIEQCHLPELKYYRISELGSDPSGRAIRFMLSGAIDRAIEARGNAEHALSRLDAMALTIGAIAGLFKNIGSYEAGDFEHGFAERDVIPLSALEEAQVEQTRAQAAYSKVQAGWSAAEAMREYGLTEDEIATVEGEKETGANTLGSALLRQFNTGQ